MEVLIILLLSFVIVGGFLRWVEKGNSVRAHIHCLPENNSTPVPKTSPGYIQFACPYDLILSQSTHEEGGWNQRVSLQHRLKVPNGYMGILTVFPGAFRMSNGQKNFEVVSEAEFLPPGWEGNLSIFLMNRHPQEPAVCDLGSPVAVLYFLPVEILPNLVMSIG